MKLPFREMKALLSEHNIPEGESVNIHHCKEGKGNDKLYITNKGDCYLFYCHHCRGSGKVKINRAEYKRATSGDMERKSVSTPFIPSSATQDTSRWPVNALLWPLRASLSHEDIKDMSMYYNDKDNRLYVPLFVDGKYNGFISRQIDSGDGSPKYVLKCIDIEKNIYSIRKNNSGRVVIVEDILSAYRLGRLGINAVALLGGSLSNNLKNLLTSCYNEYVIWMDNDKVDIKLNQAKLKRELNMYGVTYLIKTDKDPKEYVDSELISILENIE